MIVLSVAVLVIAAATTVGTALAVFPLLKRAGVVDVPSHRSSHAEVTVRGGGVAIGSGVTVATVVATVWIVMESGAFGFGGILMSAGFLVLTWCYSVIGMSDDLDSIQPIGRLIGQVALALIFSGCIALVSTHGVLQVIMFAVIGVAIVNAVNFVDGLNGYVTGWTVVTGAWYAFVASWIRQDDLMLISFALTGAACGFLPFNVGKARAFLGDTSSYGIGAAIFAIAIWLFISGVPVVVIIAPLVFIIFDVGCTLIWRLYQGENILLPHRTHIYQRIQQAGWSHGTVSLFHAALTVLACVLAVPTLISGNTASTYPAHVFWVGLLALYALVPLWQRRRDSMRTVPA